MFHSLRVELSGDLTAMPQAFANNLGVPTPSISPSPHGLLTLRLTSARQMSSGIEKRQARRCNKNSLKLSQPMCVQ